MLSDIHLILRIFIALTNKLLVVVKRYCSGKVRNVWLCTLYFDLMAELRTFHGDLSGLLVQYRWKLEQSLPLIILFLRHLVVNSSKQKTASHLHLNGKGDWSDHNFLLLGWSLKNIILCLIVFHALFTATIEVNASYLPHFAALIHLSLALVRRIPNKIIAICVLCAMGQWCYLSKSTHWIIITS